MTVSVSGRLSERTDHGHAYTHCEWKPFSWPHPQSRGQHHSAKKQSDAFFLPRSSVITRVFAGKRRQCILDRCSKPKVPCLCKPGIPKLPRNIVKLFFDIPNSRFRVQNLVGNDAIHGSASLESGHPIHPGSGPALQISQLRWL